MLTGTISVSLVIKNLLTRQARLRYNLEMKMSFSKLAVEEHLSLSCQGQDLGLNQLLDCFEEGFSVGFGCLFQHGAEFLWALFEFMDDL